jgi:hypothetical protein
MAMSDYTPQTEVGEAATLTLRSVPNVVFPLTGPCYTSGLCNKMCLTSNRYIQGNISLQEFYIKFLKIKITPFTLNST